MVVSIRRWDVLLVSVISLGVAVVAAWYVVSRRGSVRAAAAVLGAIALVVFVVVILASQSGRVLAVGLALAAISTAAAGYALAPTAQADDAEAAPKARQAVLIMNPRSGGGKVERFGLVDLCRQRGVEPYVLKPGDDLREVAEAAVARGADLLGMAGGDGSLALVASIASRHGLPFVVVPAGTRNHFALDLGIDREDVPGALDAFDDGVDTRVDLAEINGQGVRQQRVDGRVREGRAVGGLPRREGADRLGPAARHAGSRAPRPSTCTTRCPPARRPFRASCCWCPTTPTTSPTCVAEARESASTAACSGSSRCESGSAADAEKLAALEMTGQVQRFAGWNEWTASEFEVHSAGPVEVGVDGEALVLDPPLRFTIRPGAVTVRLPRAALRRSRAAHPARITARSTLAALWQLVTGRHTEVR